MWERPAIGVDMVGHLRPNEVLTKDGKRLGHPKVSTAIMSLFNEEMANGRGGYTQLAGLVTVTIIHKICVTLPFFKETHIDRMEERVFLIKQFNKCKPK